MIKLPSIHILCFNAMYSFHTFPYFLLLSLKVCSNCSSRVNISEIRFVLYLREQIVIRVVGRAHLPPTPSGASPSKGDSTSF